MQIENDTLVPDRQVMTELSISAMGLWRWERDPALQFPPAIRIRRRKFRSRAQLENFKLRMIRAGIAERTPRATRTGNRRATRTP